MNIEKKELPNFGYLIAHLPKNTLLALARRIDEIKNNYVSELDYSKRLVANIKHSYDISDCNSLLEPHIQQLIKTYDVSYPGYLISQDTVTKSTPLNIHDTWVNFQRPGELNPNHWHPGIFSFVVWMRIPYLANDQQQGLPGAPVNGLFEFTYSQITGIINHICLPADSTWQGKLCFFPSGLQHCVYPFRTNNDNDLRITVAGNVRYQVL
jgi:hypothetical protein